MAALGALALLVGLGIALAGLVVTVWAFVHLATTPSQRFRAGGQSRELWLAVVVVCFFLQPLGVIASAVYVLAIRPKVNRAVPVPAWGQPLG